MVRKRGQSILYTVLLLPTVILVFSLAVDIGSLQMQKLRLRLAVDMAAVDGATAVDARYYSQTGNLRLDSREAVRVAREYLYRNLARLGSLVGGEAGAAAIARAARFEVVNKVPGRDPFTGTRLDRPAICAQIRVPYRSGLFHWIGTRSDTQLTLQSDAEVRT